jgi:hypothetical protein
VAEERPKCKLCGETHELMARWATADRLEYLCFSCWLNEPEERHAH